MFPFSQVFDASGRLLVSRSTPEALEQAFLTDEMIDWRRGVFCGADFGGITLIKRDFSRCVFGAVSFRGAKICDCNFTGAKLQGADFSHSQLYRTNFARAKLAKANFNGATLSSVDLTGANLAK